MAWMGAANGFSKSDIALFRIRMLGRDLSRERFGCRRCQLGAMVVGG
jgi:hypothetical protein